MHPHSLAAAVAIAMALGLVAARPEHGRNGAVLLIGGNDLHTQVTMLDVRKRTWHIGTPSPLATAAARASLATFGDNKNCVIQTGGLVADESEASDQVLLLNNTFGGSFSRLLKAKWQQNVVANMITARAIHVQGTLANGHVVVVGGYGPGLKLTATAESWDPKTNKWHSLPAYPGGALRNMQGAAQGHRLYVTGGYNGQFFDTMYAYDSQNGHWKQLASMPTNRASAGAAFGYHGDLMYVAGGYPDAGDMSVAYDVKKNTWKTFGTGLSISSNSEGVTVNNLHNPDQLLLCYDGMCFAYNAGHGLNGDWTVFPSNPDTTEFQGSVYVPL